MFGAREFGDAMEIFVDSGDAATVSVTKTAMPLGRLFFLKKRSENNKRIQRQSWPASSPPRQDVFRKIVFGI